jgi:hypothetical protein
MPKFDLSQFETRTKSEAGVPMPLLHPRNITPLLNDDGTPASITLLGRSSDTYRETFRMLQEERIARMAAGIRSTPEDQVQEATRRSAQRNTVVAIASGIGSCVPNARLTAGTSASGIGARLSVVPMRLQVSVGDSAWVAIDDPEASNVAAAAVIQRGVCMRSGAEPAKRL